VVQLFSIDICNQITETAYALIYMVPQHPFSRLLVLLIHAIALPSLLLAGSVNPIATHISGNPTGDVSALSCMTVTTTTTNSSCTVATGTATANVVGGTGPYTYTWSNGQTTQTATGLGTLVHSVTVVDVFGCTQVATADVDNGGPNINVLTVNNPTCNGLTNGTASVTWTGGGFVFAAWRIPALVGPANSVTGLAPGTFSVGVGDAGTGCADSMLFTVINPPALANNFNPTQTSCNLNNGAITALGTGGTGAIGYAWSNSQSGPSISNLAPGNYTVTLTDANFCTANFTTTINGSSAPTISLANSTQVACNGASTGAATVAGANGTPGYNFLWSNSQTGATASNLIAGSYTVTLTDAANCTVSLPVTISQPSVVTGTVSTVAVGCNVGSPNGSATANPSGGVGPYTYLWNTVPAQTTQTATGIAIGNYTVTITDANSCSTTASGTVGATSTPTVAVSPGLIRCAGSPASGITATASGGVPGYAYTWSCNQPTCAIDSVNDNDPAVNPTTTTMYYVLVTDQNGCTTTDSVLVNVLPLPVANAGPPQTMCAGDTLQLAGSATGAGPVYTYSWTPSTGLSDPNIANPLAHPLVTTTYTLNVASNGCTGTPSTVTITVNPVPSINAGSSLSTCFGNQATLTAVSAGANPVTFTWTTGATVISLNGPSSINVVPTATTTYTVVATSANNCTSASADVTVTVLPFPQANAGPDYAICDGQTVTLLGSISFLPGDTLIDQSGVVYSWSPATGLSDPNIAQPTSTVSSSTTYTLTVTHLGCQSQNTVQVDVFPLPTAVANASDLTICSGDSIQLLSAGSVGTSIVWTPTAPLVNPSSVNPIAFPPDSMMFYLTVSNGPCTVEDSVFVNVPTTPLAFFEASDTIVCVRQALNFQDLSQDGTDITWTFSNGHIDSTDGDISYSFPGPGNFNLTMLVEGEGGCTDEHVLAMQVLLGPNADFVTEPPYDIQQTFPGPDYTFIETSTDEIEWIWRFPGDSVLEEQEVNHVFTSPGAHFVELVVIDAEGCRDSAQHVIMILPNIVQEYNVFTPNGDGFNDEFLIDYTGNREFLLTIFDRWGRKMFITTNKLEGWDGKTAGGADVPDGVYYYTLWVGPDQHSVGNITLIR
jgi:gliding motility-associated-like protein